MKLLLEFKDYNDLSFVKDTVEDSILSEIDESINPVVSLVDWDKSKRLPCSGWLIAPPKLIQLKC